MSDVNARIRERIEAFVAEISEMVRQSALESVADALGGGDPSALVSRPFGELDRRGGKRSPEQIGAATSLVIDFVRDNPGQGVEQMAKALGTDTRDLTLPIRKLLAAGQLSTEGQKRATKYYVTGEEPKTAPVVRRPRAPGKARRARPRRTKS